MKTVSSLLLITLLSSICLGSVGFSNIVLQTSLIGASTTLIPWPMFRHDPLHTGYTTSTAPSTALSLWNFTTYGLGAVTSSPAVAEGKVFFGSVDDNVYALNQSTGEAIWIRTTQGDVHSSPAVADGRVFVGSPNINIPYAHLNGSIYAFNASTGETIWKKELIVGEDEIKISSPVISGKRVYVTSLGAHWTGAMGCGSKIYALEVSTGTIVWEWMWDLFYWYSFVDSSPAVAGELVFLAAHGEPWEQHTRVFALHANNGSLKWSAPLNDGGGAGLRQYSSPSIDSSSGLLFIGHDNGYLYAFKYDTGELYWKISIGAAIRSSPAVAHGKVFVGSDDGNVYAFSQLGFKIWNYTTGGAVRSSPAVADGKVIVGSDDGYLYVLNETTGSLIWKFPLGGMVESSPSVADGLIFVGSDAGKVHAFGPGLRTPTKIQFSLTPNPAIIGQTISLLGNLTTTNNSPIGGENVVVGSNGSAVATLTTNSTGWFKASGQVGSAGTFNITCGYEGSTQHLPSSDSQILVVMKAQIQTEIFAKFVPNPVNSGDACELRGILVDQFSNPIWSATVSLEYSTDYGLSWHPAGSLTTDSYGIFSKTFTAPSPGTYIVRMSYAGSPSHKSSTVKVPLIVR